MRKLIMILTVLASIYFPDLGFANPKSNNETSIVKVQVPIHSKAVNRAKQGTGFFVDKSHVLTCKHVALQPNRDPAKPIVVVVAGKRYSAVLIAVDDKEDLALLYVSKPVGAPLRVRDGLINGDRVLMNSFDQDSNIIGSVGRVTKLYFVQYFMGNFHSSIKGKQGNSGSPIIKNGYVVGMYYAYDYRLKESLNVGAYKINMFIHKYIDNLK